MAQAVMVRQHGKSYFLAMQAQEAIARGETVYLATLDGVHKIVGTLLPPQLQPPAAQPPGKKRGKMMVAHVNGKKRCDAWYAEAGPHAGMFRGVILQYRSPPGCWDIVWRSANWYASAQQARGVAFNHLRKV